MVSQAWAWALPWFRLPVSNSNGKPSLLFHTRRIQASRRCLTNATQDVESHGGRKGLPSARSRGRRDDWSWADGPGILSSC